VLDRLLESRDPRLRHVLDNAAAFRAQLLLAQPAPDGWPARAGFRVDAEYFYPASTVKLAAAAVSLTLAREQGISLDAGLVYHPTYPDQAREDRDPTNVETGRVTLAHDCRKVALVSDNPAHNRLFGFAGHRALNERLWAAGLSSARIAHRLADPRTEEENRQSPRIEVLEPGAQPLPARTSTLNLPTPDVPGLLVGHAHWASGHLVHSPMDFSNKNRLGLADLQHLLALVTGDVAPAEPAILPHPDDRRLLISALTTLPRHSKNPLYPVAHYPDDYAKFLRPGLEAAAEGRFEVTNKVGWAYGFVTENARVLDRATGRRVYVAATLWACTAGVLNAGEAGYEVQGVALPFLAGVGEAVGRALIDGRGVG
jgi:hypothetical protein